MLKDDDLPTEKEHAEEGYKKDSVIYKAIVQNNDLPTEKEHDEVGDKEYAVIYKRNVKGWRPTHRGGAWWSRGQ